MSTVGAPIFFLDRNLGHKIVPRMLREAGLVVEPQDDHFAQGTADEEWLKQVGKRGWFVITLDERIRYRKLEQEAVRSHKVGMFLLVRWKGSTGEALAEALIRAKKAILRFAASRRRPFIAKLYADGRVNLWLDFGRR